MLVFLTYSSLRPIKSERLPALGFAFPVLVSEIICPAFGPSIRKISSDADFADKADQIRYLVHIRQLPRR